MDTILLYGAALALFALSALKDRGKTRQALRKGLKAFEGILPQFLTVLVLVAVALSVFDADAVSRYLGPGSGWFGVAAAAMIGSITLIPGFVAFPAAGELLRNGAGVLQVATFVSTLMMVGVVTLPLEIKTFGKRAALARNLLALVFALVAAIFISWAAAL